MFLDPNSQDKIKNANGDLITQQLMVLSWESNAGLAGPRDKFNSLLPDDSLLDSDNNSWFKRVAQELLQNQQTQMMNMSTALNQSFFNKVVSTAGSQSGSIAAGLGALEKFVPEIGNMAAGRISGMNMSIGGNILVGVGDAEAASGNAGAALGAIKAVEGVMKAAVGGLSAISAINPIVGAVLAAGFMIGKAAAAEGERRRFKRVEKDNAFYSGLYKLPRFNKSGDELAMDEVLRAMPKPDWTNLFLPRYNPGQAWVGRMAQTGIEFFPGDGEDRGWGAGEPGVNKYKGVDGLGLIPGTQQVTGSLQGRLSSEQLQFTPKGEVDHAWEWAQTQGPRTVGTDAIDTGDYYPSSAQTMSFLWGHIQTQGASGNPDLYKIDCPMVDGQWASYCAGAWDYLHEMCNWDAYNFDMKGKSMQKHIDEGWQSQARRKMMVAQQSCIIACLLGVYRCNSPELGGGLLPNGTYKQGMSSRACKTGFNNIPSDCRESIYDAYIHDRVVDLHQAQFDMLSASMVSAYVRSDFAAFQGSPGTQGQAADMMEKLKAMRTKLLDRPDQWKYLVEADVPREEMHGSDNWYQLLKTAGAFDNSLGLAAPAGQVGGSANYGNGGMGLKAGFGFETPAPAVLQLVGRVPGQELVEESARGSGSKGGGKGVILLAAAALGFMALRNKR